MALPKPYPVPKPPKVRPWNPGTDPYVLGVQGQANQDIASTKANELDKQKQLLLGFGSQELARGVLGNDPFVGLVSDNPYTSTSTLGQIGYGYQQGQKAFNEQQSANNLFYGGGRGVGLRDLAHQNQMNVANATSTVRGQLTQSNDVVAQAQRDWAQRMFQANWDAYKQWLLNRGVGGQA